MRITDFNLKSLAIITHVDINKYAMIIVRALRVV
jgi:hypothetical protein